MSDPHPDMDGRRERRREYLRAYRQRPDVRERRCPNSTKALVACAACGRTGPPAETDAGALACMLCGSTEVGRGN